MFSRAAGRRLVNWRHTIFLPRGSLRCRKQSSRLACWIAIVENPIRRGNEFTSYFPKGLRWSLETATSLTRSSAIALAAELALDTGDLTTARLRIDAHRQWLDPSMSDLWQADQQLLWARYHQRAWPPRRRSPACRIRTEVFVRIASAVFRLITAHRLLVLLEMRERHDHCAAAHLDQSLTLANACVAPSEQALTLLALAELHASNGQSANASAMLDRVRLICVPLNARPTLERAAALEPRIGLNRPNPDGLTTREVEVSRRIAAGDSNRQIADALYISPRTIERHIANII